MGECRYTFECSGSIEQIFQVFQYIHQNINAHDFWQEHRDIANCLELLREKFPLVMNWLEKKTEFKADGSTNCMAGYLIDLFEPINESIEIIKGEFDREPTIWKLVLDGTEWHLASWQHLVDYAKNAGCIKAKGICEEGGVWE